MSDTEKTFEDAKADGGPVNGVKGAMTLEELKTEVQEIVNDMDRGVALANVDAQAIRLCEWAGQAPDARKHEAYMDEVPEPFEGATDGRYRIADMVTNEDVMLCTLATLRSQVEVIGREPGDDSRAANAQMVLRYCIDSMGFEFMREVIKLAQYVTADSPAVGLMSVYWKTERAIEMKTMSADDLLTYYIDSIVQAYAGTPEEEQVIGAATSAAQGFLTDLMDETVPDEPFVELLMQFFPDLKEGRAKKVIRELREYGQAAFPIPVDRVSTPWICAKRYMQDFWLASNTQDFQRSRVWFESEWLSKAEVHERAELYGWNASFVEQVLKQEGHVSLPEYERRVDNRVVRYGPDRYRWLYQILHANFRAVNEDGVIGRYRMTFHTQVDVSANGIELVDTPHGNYTGHFFQREVLNNRILDSRGVAELSGPHQSLMKLFGDSAGDNGQLSGVPPMVTRGRRNQGNLYIAPLVELQAKRDGDYSWLNPPQYPQTIFKLTDKLQEDIDQYHGRDTDKVSDGMMNLHRQFKVAWWMSNMTEVYKQMLALCQAYMPDEVLSRITNTDGAQLIQSREDIAGQFDLKVSFDPMDLDPAYLERVGKYLRDILMVLDRDNTINLQPVVQNLFYRIAPALAERSIKTKQRANEDELQAELKDYMKILGGIEPERVTDGSINYGLRAQWYRDNQLDNPEIYTNLPPDRQKILTAHVQYLEVMNEQYTDNVQIGREGSRRALSQETEAAGVQE